jgi:hypothetical protein
MWDWAIRAKRVKNMLPVLENVLTGFGGRPSLEKRFAKTDVVSRTASV